MKKRAAYHWRDYDEIVHRRRRLERGSTAIDLLCGKQVPRYPAPNDSPVTCLTCLAAPQAAGPP